MMDKTPLTGKMGKRNAIAFLFTITSFLFLVPGVYLSMLTIQSKGEMEAAIAGPLKMQLFKTSNSILNTVQDLFMHDNRFVACMIFLFSVIVPVVKGVIILAVFFSENSLMRKKLFAFVKAIGKWSMCDVFIVAIFLAYFSTKSHMRGTTHETYILGFPIDVNVLIKMNAQLEIGFYCFLTYCILSLIALQLYKEY